jgi:ferrous iron transport protein B
VTVGPAASDPASGPVGAAKAGGTRTLVALVGNPNTGKTTLFNALTGARAKVGNYPGVTVERTSGTLKLPAGNVELVDVPGCYSLSARSAEEQIAISSLLGTGGQPRPDVVVVVVDATQLGRNLYLALQVSELAIPVVIALNMRDEAGPSGPDPERLGVLLGVPCVGLVARKGQGVEDLRAAIAGSLQNPRRPRIHVDYGPIVDRARDAVRPAIPKEWQHGATHDKALALWALLSIDDDDELDGIPASLRQAVNAARQAAEAEGHDLDAAVIAVRYAWIDERKGRALPVDAPAERAGGRTLTERIDAVLLHPVWGFLAFLLTMGLVFQSLFAWADPAIGLIETLFGAISDLIVGAAPPSLLTDLIVDGLIAGVGSVVVFLPQILLLFFFIGLMEDSGYMARVAYLMDRIMRALGLNGRAFVPMLSGFACAVPAVMATRTMERQRDRLLTMMVVPLMTCSARLPVYTLIIAALFPPGSFGGWPVQGGLMVGMYLFSTTIALVAAAVLGRTVLKGPRVPLLMELPPYRLPLLSGVLRQMWERGKTFLREAGTIILVCTVVLWGLLTFPRTTAPEPGPDAAPGAVAAWQAEALEQSYGGRLGHAIEPVIAPLGFDWKVGVGIIGAFAAREVFVATMGLVYGVGDDVDEESSSLRERIQNDRRADGTPVYTPLMGLSLMVFFALACQCLSTLAVVKRETRGWRWPTFLFVYMTVLAWVASFCIYQGGLLLGLG